MWGRQNEIWPAALHIQSQCMPLETYVYIGYTYNTQYVCMYVCMYVCIMYIVAYLRRFRTQRRYPYRPNH